MTAKIILIISFQSAVLARILTDFFYGGAKEIGRSLDRPVLSETEKYVLDALPATFTTEEGRVIAKRMGLGKTCYHQLLNKVKGIAIEQPLRGRYKKKDELAYMHLMRQMKIKK